MVMGQHFGWLLPSQLGNQLPRYATGNVAVLTFFALSGFIIVDAADNSYNHRAFAFLQNRAMRIFPPLLVALLLSVGVHDALMRAGSLRLLPDSVGFLADRSMIFSWKNLVYNVLYTFPLLGHLARPTYRFLPYAWAIRTELTFYLVLSGSIWISSRFGPLSRVLRTIGCLFLLLSLEFHLVGKGEEFRYFPYFAYGGLIYYANKGSPLCALLACASLLLCLYDFSSYDAGTQASLVARFGTRPWLVQYFALLLCLSLVWTLSLARSPRPLIRFDQVLGGLSYALYLNQFVCIIAIYSILRPSYAALCAGAAAAIAVAVLMTSVLEPFLKPIRDRIRGVEVAPSGHSSI